MKKIRFQNFLFLAITLISFNVFAEKIINITTNSGQLMFDKTNLTANPNESLKLTFKNGSSKGTGLQHNWVLVKPGKVDAISTASIVAGADKSWLADSSDIIAHTKLLNAGESETLTFNAPSVTGDYPYLCSFPGHSATMKGVLHIK